MFQALINLVLGGPVLLIEVEPTFWLSRTQYFYAEIWQIFSQAVRRGLLDSEKERNVGFTRGLSNHFDLILDSSWFPLHKFGGNLWKFWSFPFGAAGVNFEHSSRFCQSEGKFPTSNINKLFSYGESVFPKILVVWVIYRIAIGFYCGSFLEFDYFLAFVLHDLWQNVIYTQGIFLARIKITRSS